MPKITAETAGGTLAFEAVEGKKLVLNIEDNGIDILHRCGGNARCTTCRVEVLSGDPGEIREPEATVPLLWKLNSAMTLVSPFELATPASLAEALNWSAVI